MELLHEPRTARKIQFISAAQKEILVLTSPSRLNHWTEEQTQALGAAAKFGLEVKIFLNHNPLLPSARLAWLRAQGVQIRAGSRRWLWIDSSTEDEFWIFDRAHALGGNFHQCRELRAQPEEGRLGIECELGKAPAKTAARYFDHRWEGQPDGVALVVRHQEFYFRGGKGAEKEFLTYAARARKEICLCLTDTRISPRLYRSLLEAIHRGVQVRIFSNSFGLQSLRSRLLFGRLLRAGATLRFTSGHLPLGSVCALIDNSSIYLGALPGAVRGWRRLSRPVFLLHDRELARELSTQLERQLGQQISHGNSKAFLKASAPALTQSAKNL